MINVFAILLLLILIILKNIIKKYGLPTFDLVGKQASNAFWNLIQHADYHKEFQKKVLELMIKALKEGQVYAKNVAFLTDRVRDNYGQKIIFGTQFLFKDKKIIQKKVLYPKKLEQIRKEYGLEPTKVTLKKHYKKYKASLK